MRRQYFILNTILCLGFLGKAEHLELTGPSISEMPSPLTHFSNSVGLTLSCGGRGTKPLVVKWMSESGDELPNIPNIRERMENGSLHFTPFKPSDFIPQVHSGAYRCSVRNVVGTYLSPVFRIRAIVDQPFEVTVRMEEGTWLEGSPALLKCEVNPSSLKPFVKATTWKEIDEFGHEREIHLNRTKYEMGCDGSLLIFSSKPQQLFVCSAENRLNKKSVASSPFLFKSKQSTSFRNALAPKSIIGKQLCDSEVDSFGLNGNAITRDLLCLAVANPKPVFRWEKYEESVNKFVPVISDDENVVQSGPLLKLRKDSLTGNLTYRCEANNAFGTTSVNYSISAYKVKSGVNIEPSRVSARNGMRVEFLCRSEGDSISAYKWFKDGQLIAGETTNKLVIFSTRLVDQGVYQCFPNEAESTSSATLLFPTSEAELTQAFISQSLQPGPSVSLKCTAVGNPVPLISWFIDGKMVGESEALSSSREDYQRFWRDHSRLTIGVEGEGGSGRAISYLNISQLKVEDSGVYGCTASNLIASSSHTARLNVYGPIFVKEMSPLTLVHGETAQLPCHYGGYPVDKIIWQKDSRAITEEKGSSPNRLRVLANGSLQIERISSDSDKGSYTCVISNRKGEIASGTLHVNVMRPPVISSFKFDDDLKEGQRTSVSCNVISGDLPIDISWRKDGERVPQNLNLTETRVRFLSILMFDELREEHNGEYSCIANNSAAVAKLSSNLMVKVSPKWSRTSPNAKVVLKADHTFTCSASGVPPPRITWFREINGHKTQLVTSLKYQVGQNGTLRISQVEVHDSGNFSCEAVNGVGNGISRSIRLDVIIPAKVTASAKNVAVAEGAPASLQCQIQGDGPVQVMWKKGDDLLHSNVGIGSEASVDQEVTQVNKSVFEARLKIKSSELPDSGVYVCSASNQYGRDEDTIRLQVKARPAPPENFVVEEIGSRRIRLRWSPAPNSKSSSIKQFILEWKNASANEWTISSSKVQNISVPHQKSSAVIEGLSPVTNYEIRLFALSEIGMSLPTSPLTILTLPEAPSGPPTNVSAVPLSPKSIIVRWQPPEKQFQHGTILGYQIICSPQLQSHPSSSDNLVVDEKWEQEKEVRGLRPNSNYRVTIRAYNSAGTGPESPFISVFTPEGAPDSPPLHLQCSPLSPKSLQVGWDLPPSHLSNGNILGYKVIYLSTQAEKLGEKPEVKKTSNRETTLHGLRSYTNYSVKVLAFTAGGEGALSPPVICNTEEDVPDEPADIKVLQINVSSVLVSWLPPHSPNGLITKYTIFTKSLESSQVREKQYSPLSAEDVQPSWEIRRLKENAKYSFWVTASTKAGSGRASKTEQVQLLSSPKFPPRIASFPLKVKVVKNQSLRLPCKVVSFPSAKVTWLRNQQSIYSNSMQRNGSLYFNQVNELDEGEYICKAENELGVDVIHHEIVLSRAPPPIQLFVGYVTDNSIQVHWDPPAKVDPPLTSYILEIKRDKEWKSIRIGPLLTSYSLEELNCGTQYGLRITGENSVGRGDSSSIVKSSTNGNLPDASPRLTEILDGNGTMIRIDLNRWPDGGCPLTNYEIDYRKEIVGGGGHWTKISRKEGRSSVLVFQTEPYQKYQIKIRVQNDAGEVSKIFYVESQPDFFLNYAKVLERVELEEKLNGGNQLIPFYTDPHVIVPIVSALICTIALSICALMIIKRKKPTSSEWKFSACSGKQSWISSNHQGAKCSEKDSPKGGTEESMSIYATLNSTKPIPMTIRDSTVRLHSFAQHENYDAPSHLIAQQTNEAYSKKKRRKSKSSYNLEEMCMQQEFPANIEPPREFRSSSSSHQLQHNVYHPHPGNQYRQDSDSDENA